MKICLCEMLQITQHSFPYCVLCVRVYVCAWLCIKSVTQALISNNATATQEHARFNLLNQLNMPARLLIDWHVTNKCPVVQSCNAALACSVPGVTSFLHRIFKTSSSSKSKYHQHFGTLCLETSITINNVFMSAAFVNEQISVCNCEYTHQRRQQHPKKAQLIVIFFVFFLTLLSFVLFLSFCFV